MANSTVLELQQILNSVTSVVDPNLNPNGALTLTGSCPAAASVGIVIDNSNAQTSGEIVSFQSGGVEVANIDPKGHLTLSYGTSLSVPGNATLNTACGQSAINTGSATIVITNSLVSANSVAWATIAQASPDADLTSIVAVVCTSHTITIYGNAMAGAPVTVNWAMLS